MAKYNARKHCIESDDGRHLATLNPAIRSDDGFRIADGWGQEFYNENEGLSEYAEELNRKVDECDDRIRELEREIGDLEDKLDSKDKLVAELEEEIARLKKGDAEVIRRIAACSAGKTTLPTLSCAMLEVSDGRLYATATNLDLWHRAPLPVALDGPHREGGVCCVDLDAFAALCSRANGEGMQITWAEDKLRVFAGNRKAEIRTLPAAEFPDPPKAKDPQWASLSGAKLARAMRGVQFAVSADQTRYVLNGLYVREGEVIATNGRMLAKIQIGIDAATGIDDVIVPTAAIGPAAEMLERVENVEVAMADACGILIRAADGEEFFSKCSKSNCSGRSHAAPPSRCRSIISRACSGTRARRKSPWRQRRRATAPSRVRCSTATARISLE